MNTNRKNLIIDIGNPPYSAKGKDKQNKEYIIEAINCMNNTKADEIVRITPCPFSNTKTFKDFKKLITEGDWSVYRVDFTDSDIFK